MEGIPLQCCVGLCCMTRISHKYVCVCVCVCVSPPSSASLLPHPSPHPGAPGIRRHGAPSGMNVPGTDLGLFWVPLHCPDPLHIPACSLLELLPGPAFYSPPIHNHGHKVCPPSLPGGLHKEEKRQKCTEYSWVLLREIAPS